MKQLTTNQLLEEIEKALFTVLPPKATKSWIELVSQQSNLHIHEHYADALNLPALDLLKRGGKRWRPLVFYLHYLLKGNEPSFNIASLSSLVELPHNGSLIIDDIEDGSSERRGGKAVHLIHGEDLSINSGNFIYFLPTYLLESYPLEDALKIKVYEYYNSTMRRLHLGQGMDIQWHNQGLIEVSIESYVQMCKYKTGALARLSAELGSLLGGFSKEEVLAYGSIWEQIGVIFQILDDIKNLTTGNPGKDRGDDIQENKKSLPVIFFIQEATIEDKNKFAILFKQSKEFKKQEVIEEAISLLEKYNSLEKAQNYALNLLHIVKKDMDLKYPKDNSYAKDLHDLVQGFMDAMGL